VTGVQARCDKGSENGAKDLDEPNFHN